MRKRAGGAEAASGAVFQSFSGHGLSPEWTAWTRGFVRKVCFLRGMEWPMLGREAWGRGGSHIVFSTAPGQYPSGTPRSWACPAQVPFRSSKEAASYLWRKVAV